MINIDDRLIDHKLSELDGNSVKVLLAISRHLNKDNKAFPSKERIMRLTGIKSMNTIDKCLTNLIKQGVIKREKQTVRKGKYSSNLYKVITRYISYFTKSKNAVTPNPKNWGTETPPHTNNWGTVSTPKIGVLSIKHLLSIKHFFTGSNEEKKIYSNFISLFESKIGKEDLEKERKPKDNIEEAILKSAKLNNTVRAMASYENVLKSIKKGLKENGFIYQSLPQTIKYIEVYLKNEANRKKGNNKNKGRRTEAAPVSDFSKYH